MLTLGQFCRQLRIEGNVLYLTSLFDWYESDFVEQAGSIDQFIANHADPVVREGMAGTRSVRFIAYDWDLNSPQNMQPWID